MDELRPQLNKQGGPAQCRPASSRSDRVKTFGTVVAVIAVATVASVCGGRSAESKPASTDSKSTVEAELAVFRSDIPAPPAQLAGAPSRDSLLRLFERGLARRDTAGLARLEISRAEFAYLYYPESKLAHPPYELDPQTMWTQIESQRDRGLHRLLEHFGGGKLHIRALDCRPPEPQRRIIIHECSVMIRRDAAPKQLFGSILERDGRFKFVGYANRL